MHWGDNNGGEKGKQAAALVNINVVSDHTSIFADGCLAVELQAKYIVEIFLNQILALV